MSAAINLPSGHQLPTAGFGLYKVPEQDAANLSYQAIRAGYRLLDTAALYGNEEGVGEGIRRAIAEGRVRRDELFITSKLWNDQHGFTAAKKAYQKALGRMGLDYLDLYLIHWPCPDQDLYVQTWQGLLELVDAGDVRDVGVSNFLPEHLTRLLRETGAMPAVNQVELHPWLQQRSLRRLHAEHSVATQAWSPLGRAKVLRDPVIVSLAAEQELTPAQLVLAWHRSLGDSAIPKASSPERIRENVAVPGAGLAPAVMDRIAELDRGEHVGSSPNPVAP